MGRMTVRVDDDLVEEARKALGVNSRAEAIRRALREVTRRKKLAQALEHQGSIDLELDQASLRRLRERD